MSMPVINHPDHGQVAAATIVTADLEGSLELYRSKLEYRLVHHGPLPAEAAALWGAPLLADAAHAVLRAASGAASWLRLIEDRGADPIAPMRSLGWASMEICVERVDPLETDFRMAPWRILGPPADLSFTDAIRAMQVAAPMGEVFYLTEIKRPVPGFELPTPASRIDRLFVLILACRDVSRSAAFYGALFSATPAPIFPATIRVVNGAWGLPGDHKIPLGTVTLGGQSLLELDGFPAEAPPRPAAPGGLPPAIAAGSFLVADIDRVAADWIAPPRVIAAPPYHGRRAGALRGPDGEIVELIAVG